jgi:hypothetical protein
LISFLMPIFGKVKVEFREQKGHLAHLLPMRRVQPYFSGRRS